MQSVMKTGRDLEATVPKDDAANIRQQCAELQTAWDQVHSLTETKAHKLDTALKEVRSYNLFRMSFVVTIPIL